LRQKLSCEKQLDAERIAQLSDQQRQI
jgi:hypothetical protein